MMSASALLNALCDDIGSRPVGSQANRSATTYVAHALSGYGFDVERQPFDCIDWRESGALLLAGDTEYDVLVGPFSPPASLTAEIIQVSSLTQLAQLGTDGARNRMLLLHGDIASEQLFPRNFPYLTIPEHTEICRLIDDAGPSALISACPRSPETAGGTYPVPMFEDGDLLVPFAYMSAEEGSRLVSALSAHGAVPMHGTLRIVSERRPARAENVICRIPARNSPTGHEAPRIIMTAHIDTKPGTSGALDNAAGVVTLILVAGRLKQTRPSLPVEIAILNGEDYYSAPGQVAYMGMTNPKKEDTVLAINVDGVGLSGHTMAYSTYLTDETWEEHITSMFAGREHIQRGPEWYQGDHSIFIQRGISSLAFTSAPSIMHILLEVAHTSKDSPELIDPALLNSLSDAIAALAASPLP